MRIAQEWARLLNTHESSLTPALGCQVLLVDGADACQEPPYTEPYVRWCGRTAGATPPPTR